MVAFGMTSTSDLGEPPPASGAAEKIARLVRSFLVRFGGTGVSFEREALERRTEEGWPDKVRQLKYTAERLL